MQVSSLCAALGSRELRVMRDGPKQFRSSILKEIEKDIGGRGNVKMNAKNLKGSDEGLVIRLELGRSNVHHIQNIFLKKR